MALVSDVTTAPLSGLNHIDALLNNGPGWNWLTPTRSVIYYTFSVSSGNETGNSSIGAITAFNAAQQSACLSQLSYISQLTGITFTAATAGSTADLHFAATNILGSTSTSGLCSWSHGWSYNSSNVVTSYSADAYVYLDNVEWGVQNGTPSSGTRGYETLLHELGHALGLKHPFEGSTRLPTAEDNTANSIMSYTDTGGPYSTFGSYDVAALIWIYGGEGLGGSLGVSTTGKYIVGKSASDTITGGSGNDKFQGLAGNDTINGGTGNDTAIYSGSRSSYTITVNNGVYTVSSSAEGSDSLTSVEYAQFADQTVTLALIDTNAYIAGTAGRDVLTGTTANDSIDGGGDTDTLTMSGTRSSYTVTKISSGWTVSSTAEGTDTLSNVERLRFSDGTLALDNGNWQVAGEAYRLYQAAFARTPDTSGLKYWVAQLDGTQTIEQVAYNFIASAEFKALYGANPTHSQQVTALYQNVLGRTPDQAGFSYWVGLLDAGSITPAQVLINFSESAENVTLVGTAIANGIWLGA